jgi:hypothetical protein
MSSTEHTWEPVTDERPNVVHCTDPGCEFNAVTAEILGRGIVCVYPASLKMQALGPGPWTISIQLVNAAGVIVAEKKIERPLQLTDKAHIVIGPDDLEVTTSA